MDVLTDLLERSRARGAAFAHSTFHGEWGVGFPAGSGLAVHVVVAGEVHLWAPERPATAALLRAGDVVLVRGALAHCMAHAHGAHCRPLADVIADGSPGGSSRLLVGGDPAMGPPAVFFCGAYLFDGDLCDGLLAALPDVIVLQPAAGSALRACTDLLAREMLRDEPGQQTLLDRMLDVALIQALREHFGTNGDAAPPWFRASADPQVGAALRALHADPGRHWTVAALADEAALSRAAFARRFSALLGVAPLTYLTDWRMALARERLSGGREPLAAVAASLGYASEFSFAAAFKRSHGVAPGRWRARAAHAGGGVPAAAGAGGDAGAGPVTAAAPGAAQPATLA
jgi:AraC-like DNA-binding protein